MGESIRHNHEYETCSEAPEMDCSMTEYWEWHRGIELGKLQESLSAAPRDICHRIDQAAAQAQQSGQPGQRGQCNYLNIVLAGMFIMHKLDSLCNIVKCIGFGSDYEGDVWE